MCIDLSEISLEHKQKCLFEISVICVLDVVLVSVAPKSMQKVEYLLPLSCTGLGHVEDLANAMANVIGKEVAKGEIYNIQDIQSTTFTGLAKLCGIAMGADYRGTFRVDSSFRVQTSHDISV